MVAEQHGMANAKWGLSWSIMGEENVKSLCGPLGRVAPLTPHHTTPAGRARWGGKARQGPSAAAENPLQEEPLQVFSCPGRDMEKQLQMILAPTWQTKGEICVA